MSDPPQRTWKERQIKHLKVLGGILAVLWLITLLDYLIPVDFARFGIRPRQVIGLRGILFAPFLHANWGHLAANSVPLLILGWLTLLRGMRVFVIVCILSAITSGLGVWTLADWGADVVHTHVGASGVIFGLFGYLLLRAYFERSLASLLLACAVGFFYGGLVWGLLPLERDISWLGHLFGFAGGALAAWALAPTSRREKEADQSAKAEQDPDAEKP